MRNNKSSIYGNMRRQGASGMDACRAVMKSGGPDKANPFTLNKCLGEMKRQLSVGKSMHKEILYRQKSHKGVMKESDQIARKGTSSDKRKERNVAISKNIDNREINRVVKKKHNQG